MVQVKKAIAVVSGVFADERLRRFHVVRLPSSSMSVPATLSAVLRATLSAVPRDTVLTAQNSVLFCPVCSCGSSLGMVAFVQVCLVAFSHPLHVPHHIGAVVQVYIPAHILGQAATE